MDDSILLPVGTLLGGQFTVEGVLGKPGGFGVVYLARDTRLDTHVAVKEFFPRVLASRSADGLTLRPNTADDVAGLEAGRQRFLEEARLLARFQHPGVVRVRGFFEENGTAYLVMDYLDGLPLYQYVERMGGRLPVETALGIARPILTALSDLHAASILHRDIDPHNVYVTRRGDVVLLDFGSAREATEEATRALSVVVKPGYAPYEQYGSRARQGPWTDVYALGATLYRLVTGVVPPPATERLVDDELRPVRTLAPDVPPTIARAIEHALAVQPQDRPQTARAFEDELFAAAEVAATPVLPLAGAAFAPPLPGAASALAEAIPVGPAAAPPPVAAAPRAVPPRSYDADDAPPRRSPWLWALPLVFVALVGIYLATQRDGDEGAPVASSATMEGAGVVDRVEGRRVDISGTTYRAADDVDLGGIAAGDRVQYRIGGDGDLIWIAYRGPSTRPSDSAPADTARLAPLDTARRAAEPPAREPTPEPTPEPATEPATEPVREAPPIQEPETPAEPVPDPEPAPPEPDTRTPEGGVPAREARVFLDRFLALSERNEPDILAYYAPRVDRYFGRRNVSRAAITAEFERYTRQWPDRTYRFAGEPTVLDEGPGFVVVEVPVQYRVSNGSRTLRGTRLTRYKIASTDGRLSLTEISER